MDKLLQKHFCYPFIFIFLSYVFVFFPLSLSRWITHSFFSYFFLPSSCLSLSLFLSLSRHSQLFSPFSHRVQSFLSWEVPRSLRSNTKRKSQSFFGHSSFRQRKIIESNSKPLIWSFALKQSDVKNWACEFFSRRNFAFENEATRN